MEVDDDRRRDVYGELLRELPEGHPLIPAVHALQMRWYREVVALAPTDPTKGIDPLDLCRAECAGHLWGAGHETAALGILGASWIDRLSGAAGRRAVRSFREAVVFEARTRGAELREDTVVRRQPGSANAAEYLARAREVEAFADRVESKPASIAEKTR